MKDSDPQANREEAGGVLEDFKTALQVPGQSSTGAKYIIRKRLIDTT